jgi:nucleoside 2-deoxyribosyltransferase
MAINIYLAGPDVFLADAAAIGTLKQQMCREAGFVGLFPLDDDAAVGGDATAIFRANRALMRDEAEIGVFNLTPFRGPSADAGTVFELGFMAALGKPVFGYSSNAATYRERAAVPAAGGPRPRDREGFAVEDFGLGDNLMIARAIAEAGGSVSVVEEAGNAASRLAAVAAFRACLARVAEFVAGRGGGRRKD